jgi:hypothetical protein
MTGYARYPVTGGGAGRRGLARLARILALATAASTGGIEAIFSPRTPSDGGGRGGATPGISSAVFVSVPGGAFASTWSMTWKLTR